MLPIFKRVKTMQKFMIGLLSLCLVVLGLTTVFLALEEANQSLVLAGWLVAALGAFRFAMGELSDV
jgi:hypothetical protein